MQIENYSFAKDFSKAAKASEGGRIAIVPIRTGADWMESDGVIGYASTWTGARKVLHKEGYRIMHKGGNFDIYNGDEQGIPDEDTVALITVFP